MDQRKVIVKKYQQKVVLTGFMSIVIAHEQLKYVTKNGFLQK